jgi:hypothetical protein
VFCKNWRFCENWHFCENWRFCKIGIFAKIGVFAKSNFCGYDYITNCLVAIAKKFAKIGKKFFEESDF